MAPCLWRGDVLPVHAHNLVTLHPIPSSSMRVLMNLILLSADDILIRSTSTAFTARLTDPRRIRHLREVHRATVGESYTVGLADANIGQGILTHLDVDQAVLDVTLDTRPPPTLPLHIVLALPRPRMLARTLENIAALGVKHITLLNTRRVEKSYWQSPELREDKIRHHLALGLEQARDTIWPEVQLAPLFKPFVEDLLPQLLTGRQGLLAHPHTETECPRALSLETPTLLAIGPEGGFIPFEVEQLIAAGLAPVHLGPRILRVETAVVALVSRLY